MILPSLRTTAFVGLSSLLFSAPAISQAPFGDCARFGPQEVARALGIDFRHVAGFSEAKHLPETMGAGVAWLDFDGDGLLDLWWTQSVGSDGLYRQTIDGRFEDVSRRAGILTEPRSGYGQGALPFDFDADGNLDVYVAQFGPDRLWRNRGDGRFEDASDLLPRDSSPSKNHWSVSSAAADYDGDGDLDLYVAGYLEFDPDDELFCGDFETGERTYCDPSIFRGAADRLLKNESGRFVDATREAGLEEARGKGLGVVFTDLDLDGIVDLYVANDLTPNFLFQGRGDGSFEDVSLLSGAGANAEGQYEAGMGIAVGDVDRDGLLDLAVTNFDVETNTLYRHFGALFYEDVSASSGFGVPSFNRLGFGVALADFDRDGDLDAWIANGHIFPRPKRKNVVWKQPDLLLRGDGEGRFQPVECSDLQEDPQVGRGLAVADYDRDGDLDVAISNNDGPARLWRGAPTQGAGLVVRVEPEHRASGVVVELSDTEGRRRLQPILIGDSYASASAREAFFGLGEASPAEIVVRSDRGVRRITGRIPVGNLLLRQ